MEFLFAQISNIKKNYFILLILFLIILINDFILINYFNGIKRNKNVFKEDKVVSEKIVKSDEEPNNVYVDIKGEVKKPGVYLVNDKMIVNDVIKKAGGIKKGATTANINLSKKVKDQMVIIVSSKKSSTKSSSVSSNAKVINEVSPVVTTINNDAKIEEGSSGIIVEPEITNEESTDIENSTLVNINSANIDTLMTLPGIGKSKAEAIISYRKNNIFKTIEDLKNVSGIGNSIFEKVKDYITV